MVEFCVKPNHGLLGHVTSRLLNGTTAESTLNLTISFSPSVPLPLIQVSTKIDSISTIAFVSGGWTPPSPTILILSIPP